MTALLNEQQSLINCARIHTPIEYEKRTSCFVVPLKCYYLWNDKLLYFISELLWNNHKMRQTVELNTSLTARKTLSLAIIIPAATYMYLCWTLSTYMCIYFQPCWVLDAFHQQRAFGGWSRSKFTLRSQWGFSFMEQRLKFICVVSRSWYIAWGMETLK